MHRIPYGATLAVVGALALASCGGGGGGGTSTPTSPTTSAPPPTSAPATVMVMIVGSSGNTAFSPNPVKANAGDSVVFRNNDRTLHRIVIDGGPDLQDVAAGATSRAFTLSNANAINFHCTLHSSMVGSINGAAAPEPPPCNDPYGYGC